MQGRPPTDQLVNNLAVTRRLTVGDITARNLNVSFINGEDVTTKIQENVDAYPGDDIQALLDARAAVEPQGAPFFLAAGTYPETSLMIPAGVSIKGISPGAAFPNLVTFGFKDDPNTSESTISKYMLRNIQITVSNETRYLIQFPRNTAIVNITLAGSSFLSTYVVNQPVIYLNYSTNITLNLMDNAQLISGNGPKTNPKTPSVAVELTYSGVGYLLFTLNVSHEAAVNGGVFAFGESTILTSRIEGSLSFNGYESDNDSDDGNTANIAVQIDVASEGSTLQRNYASVNGLVNIPGTSFYEGQTGVYYNQPYDQFYVPSLFQDRWVVAYNGLAITYGWWDLIGGLITRSPSDNTVDTLPDAAAMTQYVRNPYLGSSHPYGTSFTFMVSNLSAHTVAVQGRSAVPDVSGAVNVYPNVDNQITIPAHAMATFTFKAPDIQNGDTVFCF